MVVYKINIPIFEGEEIIDNEVREYTRQDILNEYWNFWKDRMIAKYGDGHPLITEENCVEDWIVVHWAWVKKDEDGS